MWNHFTDCVKELIAHIGCASPPSCVTRYKSSGKLARLWPAKDCRTFAMSCAIAERSFCSSSSLPKPLMSPALPAKRKSSSSASCENCTESHGPAMLHSFSLVSQSNNFRHSSSSCSASSLTRCCLSHICWLFLPPQPTLRALCIAVIHSTISDTSDLLPRRVDCMIEHLCALQLLPSIAHQR